MKNPYQKIKEEQNKSANFKVKPEGPAPQRKADRYNSQAASDDIKRKVQSMLNKRKEARRKKSNGFPVMTTAALFLVCASLSAFLFAPDSWLEKVGLSQVHVSLFGQVDAAESKKSEPKAAEKMAPAKDLEAEETAENEKGHGAEKKVSDAAASDEELSHLSKLRERKVELDQRETELAKLEEELQKQKGEIESRIRRLEDVRDQISKLLSERVKVDQDRVQKLVEFYSSMKPQQAATIIEKLDEDLAVEVLGQMKKKSAAEIINLLEAEKARKLSEKFAGYAKR